MYEGKKMRKEINIFRVRKNFSDIKSQKGAFFIFEAAVKTAEKYKLNVYDGNGRLIYKTDRSC
jgi:N-acetylmuramoyl-L-alanine amidase